MLADNNINICILLQPYEFRGLEVDIPFSVKNNLNKYDKKCESTPVTLMSIESLKRIPMYAGLSV